jgi:hypothetical protein
VALSKQAFKQDIHVIVVVIAYRMTIRHLLLDHEAFDIEGAFSSSPGRVPSVTHRTQAGPVLMALI